jgi:hypothetical protein
VAESPLDFKPSSLALAFVTAAAFVRVPFGSFHFDDYLLLQDPAITSPLGFGGVWRLATTRPLTWLSFWADYQLSGRDPFIWHLFDLLLHIACCVLLYVCLRRAVSPLVAFVSVLIFAVHPVQVETVAWVFARSTLLCALFCLFSLRAWLSQRWWLAAAFFALALLAKEECVFFPFFLAIFYPRARKQLLTMLALAAAAGLRVLFATQVVPGAGAGFNATISPGSYLVAQGAVIWRYARLLFLPTGLTFDPDLHPAVWTGIAGWLAILSLLLLCVKFRDTWPPARWFIGGFAILLASSSIFPANDLAADRRLYLPLIAIAPAIVLALDELHVPRPAWIAVTLAFAILTVVRTGVWESEFRLWTDAVEKAPDKLRPRIQLARALPPDAALAQLDAASAIHPNNVLIAAEKGRIHLQINRPDLAIADFGQAAALEPSNPQMWNNLGGAFALLGQDAAAQRAFQRALKADPCFADTRRNLGLEPCNR